ncbi:MAG: hypothetical protein ACHQ7M_11755 [Chloroflexota bacterium]
MPGEPLAEAALAAAVELARARWGQRLIASYALGSLAHGGFSQLVSDVDLGLVLEGPLVEADAQRVAVLGREIDLPLADRLSVFWGSQATLEGDGSAGRFPPLDRLDLIRHGRLLYGVDVREGLPVPSQQELVVKGAESGLGLVRRPAYREALSTPASLLSAGPKPLTKTILFPVRFMYTARTGEIGRNHDAAEHFARTERGPMGELAAAALRWRDDPPSTQDASAAVLLTEGLRPIYELFLADHAERMDSYGQSELADQLRAELQSLTTLM